MLKKTRTWCFSRLRATQQKENVFTFPSIILVMKLFLHCSEFLAARTCIPSIFQSLPLELAILQF